jgi:hypothetical protein
MRPPHDSPSVNHGSLLGEAGARLAIGFTSKILSFASFIDIRMCGSCPAVKYVKTTSSRVVVLQMETTDLKAKLRNGKIRTANGHDQGNAGKQCLSGMSKSVCRPLPDREWEVIVYATRKVGKTW